MTEVCPGPDLGSGGDRSKRPGGRRASLGQERWEFWWEYNKDHYFARVKGTATVDAEAAMRSKEDPMVALRKEHIFPALDRLRKDRNADVRSSAILSLGKLGGIEATARVMNGLRDDDRVVRESALLALGYRGEGVGTPAILRFVENTKEHTQTRAVAATALGLAGGKEASEALRSVMEDRREDLDVRTAAAAALGLLRSAGNRRSLDAIARDRRQNKMLRAVATVSLGKIGDPADARLLSALTGEKDEEVRRSAVLALGTLDIRGPAERMRDAARERLSAWANRPGSEAAREILGAEIKEMDEAVKDEIDETLATREMVRGRLIRILDKESDLQVRQFAAISLGRLGGKRAGKALSAIMARRKPSLRSFAALGLGLSGDLTHAKMLREEFAEQRNDASHRAACAIALGLMRDRGSLDEFRTVLRDTGKDPDLRGYCAMALALSGDRSAAPLLRQALDGKGQAAIRRPAGLMLGLVGRDADALSMARRVLDANDTTVKAACVLGLGYLRDEEAAKELARLALDPKQPLLGRNYAALALGHMGDRRSAPPMLSRFAWDHNYRLRLTTLDFVTSML